MSLKLMYITNNTEVTKIAQKAGVDRIFVDMEYIGKEERQKGMNTVKSNHTVEDVKRLRPVLSKSELLVRVNPIHNETDKWGSTEEEIDDYIKCINYYYKKNIIDKLKVDLQKETDPMKQALIISEMMKIRGVKEND